MRVINKECYLVQTIHTLVVVAEINACKMSPSIFSVFLLFLADSDIRARPIVCLQMYGPSWSPCCLYTQSARKLADRTREAIPASPTLNIASISVRPMKSLRKKAVPVFLKATCRLCICVHTYNYSQMIMGIIIASPIPWLQDVCGCTVANATFISHGSVQLNFHLPTNNLTVCSYPK